MAFTATGAEAAAALKSLQSGLALLRSSNGYKAAKRDNPKSFSKTLVGRAEAEFLTAIQKLQP